jgi:hypothetical protein
MDANGCEGNPAFATMKRRIDFQCLVSLIQLLLDFANRVGRELADFLRARFDIGHHIGRDAFRFLNASLDAGLHIRRDRLHFLHAFFGDITDFVGIRLRLALNLLGFGLFLKINTERDSNRQNNNE